MSTGASPVMSSFPFGFANGVTIRNMPIALAQAGRVFWVYNGTALAENGRGGSDSNRGTFDSPKATIAGALAECRANRGDVIMVKPGHAESITAVTLLNLNVAGVTVLGLGSGSLRPTLTLGGATAATLTVSAANVALRNFIIDLTGVDAIAAGVTVNASGFNLLDNFVRIGSASAQAVLGVSIATGLEGVIIAGNEMAAAVGTAGTTAAVQIVGGSRHEILSNYIYGDYTAGTGPISNITTAVADLLIDDNTLRNSTASSTKVITCVAGTTGTISRNRMQILSGTAPITAAGMSWVGQNYYAAAVATAGTLI